MRKSTVFTTLVLALGTFSLAEAQVRGRYSTPQQTPAINQLAYGPDQCLYRFTGRSWSAIGLCHRWVNSNMAYLVMTARPGVVHSVLHYAGGRLARRDDLTSRQEIWFNADGTVRVMRAMASRPIGTDCATPPGYFVIGDGCGSIGPAIRREEDREARRRVAQARGAFTIPMTPSSANIDPRLGQIVTQGTINANDILLRPPCTASYNGCK